MSNISRRAFVGSLSTAVGSTALAQSEKMIRRDRVVKCEIIGESTPVENILRTLKSMKYVYHGFPITQLEHMLQAATLARKAGESPEIIVAALCHDMGKEISNFNHEEIAAEMLRPYLSDEMFNVVKYHGVFQGRFFWDKIGRPSDEYLKHKGKPWYDMAMKFTAQYDAEGLKKGQHFDSLESFLPELREVVRGRS